MQTRWCDLFAFWVGIFLLSIFLSVSSPIATTQAQPPSISQWSITYGGSGAATAVQPTLDGGFIVAGYTLSFGSGLEDIWILKLNVDGQVDWQKTYGGTSSDSAWDIQQASDGSYIVVGQTNSFGTGGDAWILKLNSDGSIVWQKTYGGSGAEGAKSVQITSDGGYIVAGQTSSFSSGFSDTWVLKLNSDGSIAWQKSYGYGGSFEFFDSIKQTSDGGYIAVGHTSAGSGGIQALVIKLTDDGSVVWQKMYTGAPAYQYNLPYAVQQTSDDGYIIAGKTTAFGTGGDAWILKLNSDGSIAWQKTYGGDSYDTAQDIRLTGDGGYVVAGSYHFPGVTAGGWIFKLDSAGNILWQKAYGDNNDVANSVRLTSDGGYIVAGSDGSDYWVAKLNSQGEIPGCAIMGTSNASVGNSSAPVTDDFYLSTLTSTATPLTSSASPQDTTSMPDVACTVETYSISGRVTDNAGNPIPEVQVRYKENKVLTNDNGEYTINGLTAGTYKLEPFHFDYQFTPFPQNVIVGPDATEQDFIAVKCLPSNGITSQAVNQCPAGAPPLLDLPVVYTYTNSEGKKLDFATVARGNYGDSRGRVNSWFDHLSPNYTRNEGLFRWDGCVFDFNISPSKAGISWYDGHNAIDFQRLVEVDNDNIFAAASGTVVEVCENDPCRTSEGGRGTSYGKYVLIKHGLSGYATFYAHLAKIDNTVITGTNVTQSQYLGKMGGTGKHPIHLHFGVYYDANKNGSWDETYQGYTEAVDPYGWEPFGCAPISTPDPWSAPPNYLWKYPLKKQVPIGNSGGLFSSPSGVASADIPPGAVPITLTMELWDAPVAEPSAQLRSVGNSFWFWVLEWLTSNNDEITTASTTFVQPVALNVSYGAEQVRHLNTDQLTVYHWNDNNGSWIGLPTTIDISQKRAIAQTTESGSFDLQAPLLCPADANEINDNYDNAKGILADGAPNTYLFDIAEDEDWFSLEAKAGLIYLIETANLASGVNTIIELYDIDGVTLLASDDNSGDGAASRLKWIAPQDGVYFIRIVQAVGSTWGCSSIYNLTVTLNGEGSTLYLPLILKN